MEAVAEIKIAMKNIPALRFAEFQGEWVEKLFDEIMDITRLAGYEYSKYWEEDENKEIIALRGYNIGKGFLNIRDISYISNDLSLKLGRSRLHKGDIVYPCVGSIGNAVVIEEDDKYHIQQNLAKITCNKASSPYFIVQFLTSAYGMREVYRFNATSSQPNVLVGSLRKFKIKLPSYSEQHKIATFLSSIDSKIQQLNKKKVLLEQYRKGVMQQIFSQQIRFKNERGQDFPEWEEKRLGDFLSFKNGINADKGKYGSGRKFISVLDIINNRFINYDNILGSVEISQLEFEKNEVKYGDILFQRSSETREEVGQSNVYLDKDKTATFGGFVIRGRALEEYEPVFMKYLLKTAKVRKDMTSRSGGSTRYNIGQESLKEVNILLPCLSEQKAIASFISALDDKITLVAQQLKQAQQFKIGLLQQMFV